MPVQYLAVLGDSVPWGQGLLQEHKYWHLVAQALGNGATRSKVTAHSGAIIGLNASSAHFPDDGEVPSSYPTIVQQCASFSDSPDGVDVLIVDGGINDLDVRRILDPLTGFQRLSDLTRLHCYADMALLLQQVKAKFVNAKIVVTGYFPILSMESDPLRILSFLQLCGVAVPIHLYHGPVLDKIISQCLQFWNDSNMWLERAVTDANGSNGNRVTFVPCPFTEQNAVFASDPRLFGLSAELLPMDEVPDSRRSACDLYYNEAGEIISREQCYRASAGHPNVAGAAMIAKAIVDRIRP
ncbi:MAG: SGNH/GDSL hydrolase family protein [Terriglobales bacterium]